MKDDALSKTTQIFPPNSVWRASRNWIVVSLLKSPSHGRKNVSPVEELLAVPPAPLAPRCREALSAAAGAAGVDARSMPSLAAHDSQNVARVTDAGMLFAPSRDGVSHSPREWTDPADRAAATRVLAGALATLAAD